MNDSLVVVVSSCDAFQDCWLPFESGIKKYWPDCDYRIVMISNAIQDGNLSRIELFSTGTDYGWASNLKKMLETLNCEYVLYLQEDYWLTRRFENRYLEQHLQHMRDNNVDYLRLSFPDYKPGRIEHSDYSLIPPGKQRYRLCLQAAIWRRDVLISVLEDGTNGWYYERNIERVLAKKQIHVKSEVVYDIYDKNLSFRYVGGTGVRKGHWTRAGVEYLKENGFSDLVRKRPVEGPIKSALMKDRAVNRTVFVRLILKVLNELQINC